MTPTLTLSLALSLTPFSRHAYALLMGRKRARVGAALIRLRDRARVANALAILVKFDTIYEQNFVLLLTFFWAVGAFSYFA